MDVKYLKGLSEPWTAKVKLKNGEIVYIWHTALESTKHIIDEVLSVTNV